LVIKEMERILKLVGISVVNVIEVMDKDG